MIARPTVDSRLRGNDQLFRRTNLPWQAKGVEKTLADQAEAQRKAIEDAEKR
jgi:hypothetical protein